MKNLISELTRKTEGYCWCGTCNFLDQGSKDDPFLARPTQRTYYNEKRFEIAKEIFDLSGNRKLTGKIPDGIIKEYYRNGKLAGKWNFKDGKRNGTAKLYYRNGRLWCKENYKNDKEDGAFVSYHTNGKLMSKWKCKKGKEVGLYKGFYDNGKLFAAGEYIDGKKEGLWLAQLTLN